MPSAPTEGRQGSFLQELLRSVTRIVCRYPWIALFLVSVTTSTALAFTVLKLQFKTERAALIDPRSPFHRRWLDYTESFGEEQEAIVVVESDELETIQAVMDELGARMQATPGLFAHVWYKSDPGGLVEKGLQYLSPRQLEESLDQLNQLSGVLEGDWQGLTLATYIAGVEQQLAAVQQSTGSPESTRALENTELLVQSLSAFLVDRRDFRSPWSGAVTADGSTDQASEPVYLMTDAATMGFIRTILVPGSARFTGAAQAIAALREMIAETSAKHPDVIIGLTGIPVLESDEMLRSQRDMMVASVISFVGVALLLVLGLHGFRHPILAMTMLAVGMAWSFGYTTLVVGHLNILSVSFAVILIGLGIDYAIHFLTRYLELRHRGQDKEQALLATSSGVGPGIITAAITTALAFSSAALTQFLGVAELGLIAGGGVLLCGVATFLVLPALISVTDAGGEAASLPVPFQGTVLRALTSRVPFLVFVLSFLLVAYVGSRAIKFENGTFVPQVHYDYNLLNLQAEGVESVAVQRRIFDKADGSLLYAAAIAQTPDEARHLRRKFIALPTVHHVEEVASRLPEYPFEESRLLIQSIKSRLSHLPASIPEFPQPDPGQLGQMLESLYQRVRNSNDPIAVRITRVLDSFLDRFELLPFDQQIAFLVEYQARMMGSLLQQLHAMRYASNLDPVSLEDLPPELTSRFVSPQGEWLLQVFPKDQIWDIEPLTRFVADVRSVDPDITGTPIQNYEASRQMKSSYEMSALYALAAISLVLLAGFMRKGNAMLAMIAPIAVTGFAYLMLNSQHLEFEPMWLLGGYIAMVFAIAILLEPRGICDTLLALSPPFAGGVLMFGLMAMLKVDLNAANMIVLPLVLGIGVDDGVHVVHDFRLQRGAYRMSSSTLNAIIMTSLTTMIGFGSMMISAHRGLASLGLVLVIGVGSCLFVSLFTLPATLTLLARPEQTKQAAPPVSTSPERKSGDPMQHKSNRGNRGAQKTRQRR